MRDKATRQGALEKFLGHEVSSKPEPYLAGIEAFIVEAEEYSHDKLYLVVSQREARQISEVWVVLAIAPSINDPSFFVDRTVKTLLNDLLEGEKVGEFIPTLSEGTCDGWHIFEIARPENTITGIV